MVAVGVVGDEHEGRRFVFGVAQAVVVHGAVAAAVAEGEHGHFADFLGYLQHLVGLEVLDDELVGADDVLLLAHGVVDAGLGALAGGFQAHVHADDAVGLDAECFDQGAADEAVGAGDDVVGEAVVLQVFEDLEYGLVEALGVGHAGEAVGGVGGVGFHVGVELGDGHAGVGFGGGLGVLHVEVGGQAGAVAHKVADFLCGFPHVVGGDVFVGGVVQDAVFEQVVLEVGGVELTDEGAVHVEGGDAVLGADVVGGRGVGDVLDVFLQGRQRGAGVPRGEVVFLGCEFLLAAAREEQHQGDEEQG